MYVLEQNGKAAYNISTASCVRLELTKEKPQRYGEYAKYAAVIMLYYINEGGCILGGYESAEEAAAIYKAFIMAIADGVQVFDLNGMLTEQPEENYEEIGPIEIDGPEIGD